MNPSGHRSPAENPFSTRCVRPGAIPYLFPPGQSAAGLVERLRENAWRGQVIGPHGTGKSALLAALIPAIEQSGCPTLLIELHDGSRSLPMDLNRAPELARGTVVLVDGYEQLSFWSRWALRRICRRRQWGLVVTAHGPVGLPNLFQTTTTAELAQTIVSQLLGEGRSPIASGELERLFALRRGNMREVLFDLYDRYEQQTRANAT